MSSHSSEIRAYRVAYNGQPFRGFQRQPDVPTVERELFTALRALDLVEASEPPPSYSAAGRTDAGVSAVAQTIAFQSPPWLGPQAFNSELSRSIRVWAMADGAIPDFHATHDAIEREYTYFLHAPTADESLARAVASRLTGRHNFQNLTPDTTNVTRDVAMSIARDREFLVITATAAGFPRQLVRRLVALITRVVSGELGMADVDRVLSDQPAETGIGPAPPYGLVLSDVQYDVVFESDAAACEDVRTQFTRRRSEYRSRSSVADFIARNV